MHLSSFRFGIMLATNHGPWLTLVVGRPGRVFYDLFPSDSLELMIYPYDRRS
jgi:hypothetical protein